MRAMRSCAQQLCPVLQAWRWRQSRDWFARKARGTVHTPRSAHLLMCCASWLLHATPSYAGVYLSHAKYTLVEDVTITSTGTAAVHARDETAHVVVRRSTLSTCTSQCATAQNKGTLVLEDCVLDGANGGSGGLIYANNALVTVLRSKLLNGAATTGGAPRMCGRSPDVVPDQPSRSEYATLAA